MKIALICPYGTGSYSPEELKEPHGLLFLHAVLLRYGIGVNLIDMIYHPPGADGQIPTEVAQSLENIELLGLSLSGANQLTWARRIIRYAKTANKTLFTVAGGILATFAATEVMAHLEDLDCLIRGEGEESLLALIRCLKQGGDWRQVPGACYRQGEAIVTRPIAPAVSRLDKLPFITRVYLQHSLHAGNRASILTSRGCWGRCTFCITHAIPRAADNTAWRFRSARNVIAELDYLWQEFGIREIHFAEDTFIAPGREGKERVIRILDAMKASGRDYRFFAQMRVDAVDEEIMRRLIEAGLDDLGIGIESWAQSQLNRWRKLTTVERNYRAMEIISRYPIKNVRIGCLMFDAQTTIAELKIQIEHMSQFRQFELARCKNIVRVYPGTHQVMLLQRAGLLRGDWRHYYYDFAEPEVAWVYALVQPLFNKIGNLEALANRQYDQAPYLRPALESLLNEYRRSCFALFNEILLSAEEAVKDCTAQDVIRDALFQKGRRIIEATVEKMAVLTLAKERQKVAGYV